MQGKVSSRDNLGGGMGRTLRWIADAVDGELLAKDAQQVVDLSLTQTDSRRIVPGGLYVARVGEHADGHLYGTQAQAAGAVAVIVERQIPDLDIAQVVVENGTRALGQLAQAHLEGLRASGDISVVGITGSAGKTTTKDLLAGILATQGPTVAPERSYNNEVGCPLTVLKATDETRFLVLEMGASGAGELTYLTRIAPLDVGVVLMIGSAHLGGFGGFEAVAQAKSELVQGLVPSGVAVLNFDDPAVIAMSRYSPREALTFSAAGSPKATLWAADVQVVDGRAQFVAESHSESSPVLLQIRGAHQVQNALAAITASTALGVPMEEAARTVGTLHAASAHRMDVRDAQVDTGESTVSVRVLDDSYNANPDSMRAAFTEVRRLAGDGRVLMILGAMHELGPDSDALHLQAGQEALAQEPAAIVLLGDAPYLDAEVSSSSPGVTVAKASDHSEALSLLAGLAQEGDTVLIKGSNASNAWRVAEAIESGTTTESEKE